jgi:hypothetical protein
MKNDLFRVCQFAVLEHGSGQRVPFVGVRVPVHLAHGARFDVQMTGSDRLGDREVLAVHNARLAAAAFVGWGVQHVVGILVLGLLKRRRLLLVNALGHRA